MDIAAWLRSLGLERYEPALRENEIDLDVLPELTEADLVTLGLPLGPRRKLLKAIAGLREGARHRPLPKRFPRHEGRVSFSRSVASTGSRSRTGTGSSARSALLSLTSQSM